MRMLYKRNYEEKYKKYYIPMYNESQKKNPDYSVVRKVPSEFINEAVRYSFPATIDYGFAAILFVATFVRMHFSHSEYTENSIGILGVAGVVYGALYAVFSDLRMKGPKIKSLRYLRNRESTKKTTVNIINTLMFWMFIAVAMEGIAGSVLITIDYIVFTLFSGIFAFIFYKERYD